MIFEVAVKDLRGGFESLSCSPSFFLFSFLDARAIVKERAFRNCFFRGLGARGCRVGVAETLGAAGYTKVGIIPTGVDQEGGGNTGRGGSDRNFDSLQEHRVNILRGSGKAFIRVGERE